MKAKRPHFDLKLTLQKAGLVCNTTVEQTPHDKDAVGLISTCQWAFILLLQTFPIVFQQLSAPKLVDKGRKSSRRPDRGRRLN